MARDQRDPAAMVKGLAEIARMLGYQAPKQFRVAVAGQGAGGRLEGMTDDELAAVIEAGSSR